MMQFQTNVPNTSGVPTSVVQLGGTRLPVMAMGFPLKPVSCDLRLVISAHGKEQMQSHRTSKPTKALISIHHHSRHGFNPLVTEPNPQLGWTPRLQKTKQLACVVGISEPFG